MTVSNTLINITASGPGLHVHAIGVSSSPSLVVTIAKERGSKWQFSLCKFKGRLCMGDQVCRACSSSLLLCPGRVGVRSRTGCLCFLFFSPFVLPLCSQGKQIALNRFWQLFCSTKPRIWTRKELKYVWSSQQALEMKLVKQNWGRGFSLAYPQHFVHW